MERKPAVSCHRQPCDPVDLLALHARLPERYPFLLESSAGAVAQGRYDMLFGLPGESLSLARGQLAGRENGQGDFLRALDRWVTQSSMPAASDTGLPFAGGWFLYLGYELAAQVEPGLTLPDSDDGLPTALAVRCPAAIIRDRQANSYELVAETAEQLEVLQHDVRVAGAMPKGPSRCRQSPLARWKEDGADEYCDRVRAIREYILAGDVFQVNLCREWQAELAGDLTAADIYTLLRESNPAPFSGLMNWQGRSLISSSPERLLSIDHDRQIATRPIAGTRPRRGEDSSMTEELITHPKERAEHVMLIDLERNDLGRVCEFGSIEVNELMTVESYAHVHHIVSNVRGRLRADVGPGEAFRAVFPGGTITGCPKVRCMEIIAELEGKGRGAYTGSLGYISRDGRVDSNILIRTLVQNGRQLSLRAGAGIVADSDPALELQETRAKARGVLLAFGEPDQP